MTKKQIFEYGVATLTVLNSIFILNIFSNLARIEYSISSLDSNMNSAIQSLSTDVWDLKTKETQFGSQYNKPSEFE